MVWFKLRAPHSKDKTVIVNCGTIEQVVNKGNWLSPK